MANWANYYFFGPRGLTDIEELHDLKITAASECHNKVLIGTETGELWLLMAPGTKPQKTDLIFPSSILHIVTAQYSQRVLIVYKEANNFVFQVYNTSDFSALYEVVVPASEEIPDISYLSCSPKLSRFTFTIDKKSFYIYNLPKSDMTIEKIQRITTPPVRRSIDGAIITGLVVTNDELFNKYIYVLTNKAILCFDIDKKGDLKLSFNEPDPFTPNPDQHLYCLNESQGKLYVCRGKTVSVYSNDKDTPKGQSHKTKEIILEANPQRIEWFRQYIIAIYPDEVYKMKIYEPSSHCVFGAFPYGANIKFFLNEWSGLTLIRDNGELLVLDEPSTEQKIQKLCTRFNQFDIALILAQKQKDSAKIIASIHQTKGDKMYARKNFEESISEYIYTIGVLEPSYVIKKFLDPQHANLLIRYLEALQTSTSLSSSGSTRRLHSTLLFNCYAKLRREDALREKVELAAQCKANDQDPPYDIESAIDVLTRSGYVNLARDLAQLYGKHDIYMKILYNSGDYKTLYEHFSRLGAKSVEKAIAQFGSWVLSKMETEEERDSFINLAVNFCAKGVVKKVQGVNQIKYSNGEKFKLIFADDPSLYHKFLSKLCQTDASKLTESLWTDYIETTLNVDFENLNNAIRHPQANYNTEEVLIILQEPAIALYDKKVKYDKAIKANKPTDINIDEIMPQLRIINEALMEVYRKRNLITEILGLIPYQQISTACETYGTEDNQIFWLDGLREAERRNQASEIQEIAEKIHEKDYYPINSMLKPKTSFSEFTYGIFADMIQDDFKKMQDQIAAKSRQLQELDEVLQKDSQEVETLTTHYGTIKPMNCAMCKLPLDRPSYHFLCGHSFHKQCLDDGAEVCRVCQENHIVNARMKLFELEKAQKETDVLRHFRKSKNPQESLAKLLEGGFFAPEIEFGGEDEVHKLATRLQPNIEQISTE